VSTRGQVFRAFGIKGLAAGVRDLAGNLGGGECGFGARWFVGVVAGVIGIPARRVCYSAPWPGEDSRDGLDGVRADGA
jgi:hypothetical protein